MPPRVSCLPALSLLALGLAACFSTGGTPASTVIPKDPTPLAKCRVAKSSASPLVTEWPASEKAHLESLLSDRAVVVSYNGCEMRILDGCRLQGSYRFQKTTLARDTIEIRSADDLFAKIPLGAVGLEGELARSGRLAVKTTVTGQMKLAGEPASPPDNAACREATHVISALSVGAFALISGGEVSAGVSVDATVAGGGVRHESAESTLRSAGDPDACSRTKSDAPSDDCNSPIQVFLMPLERGSGAAVASAERPAGEGPPSDGRPREGGASDGRPSERPPEPQPTEEPRPTEVASKPEPPADLSVEVDFEPPTPDERWMLLESSGKVVCELPCTRRVGKNSGLKLQLDAATKEDIVAVAVPDDLGYSAGRRVRAVPQTPRNSDVAAVLFYGGILGALGGAVLVALDKEEASGSQSDGTYTPERAACTAKDGGLTGMCIGGIVTVAVSGAAILAGGIWWVGYNRPEGLDITLLGGASSRRHEEPAPRVGLGPGFVVGTF
jgi:hypothetical protein